MHVTTQFYSSLLICCTQQNALRKLGNVKRQSYHELSASNRDLCKLFATKGEVTPHEKANT